MARPLLRSLRGRIEDATFGALESFLADVDRPLVEAKTSRFVRPWERERMRAAMKMGTVGGGVSTAATAAAISLAFLRRDTRELLRRHWKWMIPLRIGAEFALGAGWAYFTGWREEVTRIDHALAGIA